MTKPIPEDPKFITNATALQKWLAGIAVSMLITAYVTGFDVIQNFFKPDFVKPLNSLRMYIGLADVLITSILGIMQMIKMLDWLTKSYAIYKEMLEINKSKDKEK